MRLPRVALVTVVLAGCSSVAQQTSPSPTATARNSVAVQFGENNSCYVSWHIHYDGRDWAAIDPPDDWWSDSDRPDRSGTVTSVSTDLLTYLDGDGDGRTIVSFSGDTPGATACS